MSYKVETVPNFDRELKRLIKKYPSLKREIAELATNLADNPRQGAPLGKDFYKIRISIAGKGSGKSGGARVIANVKVWKEAVFLVSIYDKGEKDDISASELIDLLNDLPR